MRLLPIVCLLLACGGKDSGDGPGNSVPTFYADVLPIVGENCQQCHNTAAPMGAAFPLETYGQISAIAELMARKMQLGGDTVNPFFMPPFPARWTEECTPVLPYRGNYHVSEAELTLFETWIDVGKPEGDQDQATSYEVPNFESLKGDLQTLRFKGPYTVPTSVGEVTDDYRCFALETEDGRFQLDSGIWVNGFEFSPGNEKIAHHMLLYTVPDLETHLSDGLATDTDNASWACSGGVSPVDHPHPIADYNMIWAWVPGAMPLELQDDMGIQVDAGEGLVLQMHYNTLTADEGGHTTDDSTLQIRPMGEPPAREASVRLFGVVSAGASDQVEDPPFEVLAGSADHIESYAETFSDGVDQADIRIWGLTPHMHLVGTDIKFTRTRADGTEDCLGHIPRWDFNYQQMYVLDGTFEELPRLTGGDTLRVRCTFDNTDDNALLSEYLGGSVEPSVKLGDRTEDEMCVVAVGVACEGRCDF